MSKKLACPDCGSTDFYALESVQARSHCEITDHGDTGITIDQDARAEMIRDMESSVTLGYMCASESCEFFVSADKIGDLRGALA